MDDHAKINITVNFCRLANELRWKEHWRRNSDVARNTGVPPRYPYRDEISQAPRYPDFERKLARINESITRDINSVNIRKAHNLNSSERLALANLKKRDIVCLPSDKGGEFCVMENEQYLELGRNHLGDSTTYNVIKRISAKTVELRVNSVWKEICKDNNLDITFTKSYVSNNTNLAKFYFLIKTHKSTPVPKIRPIVSNTDSPTTKLSWLLNIILKPLLRFVDSHLENTSDLCDRLSSLPNSVKATFNYPFSLDAINLYTSISPQAATEVAQRRMQERSIVYFGMDYHDVGKLLEIVLNNNYFTFDEVIYHQTHGLAMGSSVSAILAILYMDYVEKKALNLLSNHVALYCRYVDDAFLLARNRSEAEHIKTIFNEADPNVKFEIEHPSPNNTLNLLDIAVHIDTQGMHHSQFYKKSAKKPIFVNYKSALPMRSKLNYIRNEKNRIRSRCSDNRYLKKHLTHFDSVLRLNGYPERLVRNRLIQGRSRPIENEDHRSVTDEQPISYSYFNVPFFSDTLNNKIRRAFRREDLNVRLSHKTYSLRSALSSNHRNRRTCNKKDCVLSEELCFRKNVVYRITCGKCSKNYIGSTIRELHQRVYEHYKNRDSSVNKHMIACSASPRDMSVSVLDFERRKGNLRVREAFFIQKEKPEINSKEESSIDLILF